MLSFVFFVAAAGVVAITVTDLWQQTKRDQAKLSWLEQVHAEQERRHG